MRRLLASTALLALTSPALAADWTVPPGASIQVFIDQASPGDRIFVEPGSYPGGISFRGKDVEVISLGGPEVTTIDGSSLPLPAVSCFSGETTAARLEGFTIVPGNWQSGPCVRVTNGAGLTVANCKVDGSSATNGGAIYVDGSTLALQDVELANCSASNHGGALYADGSTLMLADVQIGSASADDGGGIYANNTVITASTLRLENCTGQRYGGGIWMNGGSATLAELTASACLSNGPNIVGGGAIYQEGSSSVQVTGGHFIGCVARHAGGAICSEGAGPSLTVIDSTFTGCHTLDSGSNATYDFRWRSGGAIAFRGSGAFLAHGCSFVDNYTATNSIYNSGHGGAVYITRGNATIEMCEFRGNSSGGEGGAIFLGDEVSNASMFVRDCLFTENRAIVSSIQALGGRQSTTLNNCIFYGNGDGNPADWTIYFESSGTSVSNCTFAYNSGKVGRRAAFTDCIFWAHDGNPAECSFTHCDYEGGISGTGNFNLDPLFVDPGSGDYNVLPNSPCIGAGVNGGDVGANLALGLQDCNENGISDSLELAGNDCNQNGTPDDCELADGDCNLNGLLDDCDLAGGGSLDCNADGTPDECEIDCNGNLIPDDCDITSGFSLDLNNDGVPDECKPDCDGDGLPDFIELFYGTQLDCNGNAIPDDCEIADGTSADCNGNGVPDECDVASGLEEDCNGNGVPDACDLPTMDCNQNGVVDACDIAAGTSQDLNQDGYPDECKPDCNRNGIPDYLDIAFGASIDCDSNGIPDECETDCNGNGVVDGCDIQDGTEADCNGNGLPDSCELLKGSETDCDGDGVLDSCQVASGTAADCNSNGVLDACDITGGASLDCDANGVPDDCEPDCNGNGVTDSCDIADGVSLDCDLDAVPDECQLAAGTDFDCNGNGLLDTCDLVAGTSLDCDANGVPDECENDCNGNGIDDQCELDSGTSLDCNTNGVLDECDISGGVSLDCNANGVPDECDLGSATSEDCNANGVPDECDIQTGVSADCDVDGVPDECQILANPNLDLNTNGVLDSCECSINNYCTTTPNSVGPGAMISSTGTAFLSFNDFTLLASGVPPSQFGLFFYSGSQAQAPLGDGTLCVSGQIFRFPATLSSSTGAAAWALDYANPPSPAGQITSGTTWYFQFWYRDVQGGPAGSNLSDGLEVTFCP